MGFEDDLRNVELFSEMTTRDLQRLAKSVVKRSYKKGDVIVREGDLGIAFYVVSRGKVDVVKGAGTSKESLVYAHGPGGFFGEMALLATSDLRSATCRAAEDDTECLVLTKWDFNAELNAPGSKVAMALLPILAKRVRDLTTEAAGHTH